MDVAYKYILGRLVFYVPKESLSDEGIAALWHPCEGEEFDIIFFDPNYKNVKQALIHEEFHAVLSRVGLHNNQIDDKIEEIIVDTFSQFMVDNYYLKEK